MESPRYSAGGLSPAHHLPQDASGLSAAAAAAADKDLDLTSMVGSSSSSAPTTAVTSAALSALPPPPLEGPRPIKPGRIGALLESAKPFVAAALWIAAITAIVFAVISFVMGGIFGFIGGAALLVGAGALFVMSGNLLSDWSSSPAHYGMAYFSAHSFPKPMSAEEQAKAKQKEKDRQVYVQDIYENYTVIRNSGGGNCLFHSLEHHFKDLLQKDETTGIFSKTTKKVPFDHTDFRREIVAHMEAHREQFTPFMPENETIEQRIDRMAKNGAWGDEPEIAVFADYMRRKGINVQLIVHDPFKEVADIRYPHDRHCVGAQQFHLYRSNGNHWEAIVPKPSS